MARVPTATMPKVNETNKLHHTTSMQDLCTRVCARWEGQHVVAEWQSGMGASVTNGDIPKKTGRRGALGRASTASVDVMVMVPSADDYTFARTSRGTPGDWGHTIESEC